MPFAQYSGTRSTSKWGSSSPASSGNDLDRLNRSIDNARVRIEDSGFRTQDADRRNWFEKATNLPENQNAFFDALELLGRPGQAVMNMMDKAPDGQQSLGQSAWRGFAGRDRVRGSEIIEDRGINDTYAKAILGTTLEIATDPTNLIPAGGIAKGIGFVSKPVGQVARRSYNALENISPRLKTIREGVVQPGFSRFKDAVGRSMIPDYKLDETLYGTRDDTILRAKQAAENDIRFRTEESMKTVADAANAAGGVDTGTDVGRIVEAPLRQFEDVKGYEFPDGVRRTMDRKEIIAEAAANRDQIRQFGKDIRSTNKEYQEAIGEFGSALEKTNAEIRRLFASIERQAGKQLDAAKRADLRDATKQLKTVDSQIENFPQAEAALLRAYKKQVREAHTSRFDILKRIRQVAPNGVRAIEGMDSFPDRLTGYVRMNGKPIDEVANELGYEYADDLIQELNALNGIQRNLSKDEIERLAQLEMQRSGAMDDLLSIQSELQAARTTLQQLLADIAKQVPDVEGKAFADLAENPRWQELEAQRKELRKQYDALKGESKQARADKLTQIRKIEGEIDALKEAAKNPVMIQKEIERPKRELSQDQGVNKAANTLIRSNQAMREWARSNGVSIDELEGYMTHVLSAEERRARKRNLAIDRGNTGTGQPNKSIMKQRELTGSVEDINERVGRNFFEPNAYFATAIGQKRLIEYVNSVNFRKQVLTNANFAKKYEKGMDIPENAVVIDTNNYKFIKEADDTLSDAGLTTEEIGGQYIVTKSVKTALDRYQKLTTDEGINGFLKAFDGAQSFWKRATLFSLPYHLRNAAGAMFNNWVGGMSAPTLVKYTGEAYKDVFDAVLLGKESGLYREYRKQGLGSSSLSQIEFARAGEDAEKAIQRTIERRSRTTGGKVIDRLNPLNAFETSREFGDFIDQTNRFALYKWAKDKGMSPDEAAKKVREVQFDYSRTTPFEREILTRAMPFYRWMRNNLPYQIKQFINDPRKYANLNKIRLNLQESFGIDEENAPVWMKEQMALPITGKDGKGKYLGLNLPVGDLAKLSSPGKTLVDAVTPLAKLPAELTLNRNFFFNKPIENFEGQEKQYQVPFTDRRFGIDMKTAYTAEQLTGQIGRGLSGYLQAPESVDRDTQFRLPTLGISSFLKDFDAEESRKYELIDQLRKLQDYIDYIEQQTGTRPRSVNEIR